MQWTRQGAGADQLSTDIRECQDLAYREVQSRPYGYLTVGPAIVRDSAERRLGAYPPGVFADPYGDRFTEEGRVANHCMRTRGYALTPK